MRPLVCVLGCLVGVLGAATGTASADELKVCPGAWTYFSDPRAVVHGELVFVGCISNGGDVVLTKRNIKTGITKSVILKKNLGADDHNNPTIVVRKSGRLMVFYAPHSGHFLPVSKTKAIYYRISRRPFKISSWSRPRKVPLKAGCGLGYTYPNPIRLPNGDIFLAFRGPCWHPTFTILSARTGRWSRAREIIAHNHYRQYVKYAPDGRGGIDIAYTKSHPHSTPSNVYYMKYRRGAFYGASGRRIGTVADLPFKVTRGDLVYNRATHGTGWVQDVATGPDGIPKVVYQAGKTHSTVTYRYAFWNGTRWDDAFVAAGNLWNGALVEPGQRAVAGGITLSHANTNVVYLSRVMDNNNVIQMGFPSDWPTTTPDSNPDWEFKTIAGGPGRNCYRPVEARGPGAWMVFYFCGKHHGWLPGQFNTNVFAQVLRPDR